jgi:hypothetical protein
MTAPDRIRAWVAKQFNPRHVDQVAADLIDVAAGNRKGNAFEQSALAKIFPEWGNPALANPCPQCGAEVGAKCTNYADKGCAPHRQRLKGKELVASFETKATKRTETEKAEAGIFAPIVRETTARDELWRWRFNVARAAENIGSVGYDQAGRGLRWIELHHIERYARSVLPAEDFAKLQEYERRTYRCVSYGYSFWAEVLSGEKRVDLGWTRIDDPTSSLGFRCVPTETIPAAGWQAPLTKAEFYARFPYERPEPEPHDDGGTAEAYARFMAAVESKR